MVSPLFAELHVDGLTPLRFEATGSINALGLAKSFIEGWYSTPTAKTEATERGSGDGGHDIDASQISYAARTVTVHWNANSYNRSQLIALTDRLRQYTHRLVTLRVRDADQDTYCEGGFLTLEQKSAWREGVVDDSAFTIVFERPERLGWDERQYTLQAPSSEGEGNGLWFGPGYITDDEENQTPSASGVIGLHYPLSFGINGGNGAANLAVLTNNGTSRAYPVFTVTGPFPQGITLFFPSTGQTLQCSQPVQGVPLTLDCRSRTAVMGDVDVSRTLTRRGWPTVPPHGSLAVNILGTTTSGYVTASVRDTYM